MITIAIVGVGSNVAQEAGASSDLLSQLRNSFLEKGIVIVRESGLWRSRSWPDPSQPDYLNGVLMVETALSAQDLMTALLAIEARFGRTRSVPNAPRTLDLDLIAYGDAVIDQPGLIVPHPRAAERRFVMGPLCQVAPDWVHPVLGKTAEALFEAALIGRDAHPL